jgi:hypothetical protein
MKNNLLFVILLLLIPNLAGFSQVAINTTGSNAHSSAMLDIDATNKGLLIPRVALNSVVNNLTPVENPATGLLVYNQAGNDLNPGIYMWNGMEWTSLATMDMVINTVQGHSSAPCFGEMHEYNEIGSYSNIIIPANNVYVAWNTAVQGEISGMDYSGTTLIIGNTGSYNITFNSVVQLPSGGKIVDVALFVNETRMDGLHGRCWFKEGGKAQSLSFSGIIPLQENDVISVRYTMNGSGTVRLEIANLSLTKLN